MQISTFLIQKWLFGNDPSQFTRQKIYNKLAVNSKNTSFSSIPIEFRKKKTRVRTSETEFQTYFIFFLKIYPSLNSKLDLYIRLSFHVYVTRLHKNFSH